jgi:hypothetical protein
LGVVDGALQLATYDQVKELSRGLALSFVCVVCRVSCVTAFLPHRTDRAPPFAAVEQMKYRLTDERGVFPAWAQLLDGAGSRTLALVATYPYQLLRSVLQQQNCPYRSVLHATRHVLSPLPGAPLTLLLMKMMMMLLLLLLLMMVMTMMRRS